MNLDNFTYIDVILPLPLANVFTYIVPDVFELRVSLGMRVIVPFGTKKYIPELYIKSTILHLKITLQNLF